MYYHFPVQGAIQKISDATAQVLMSQISNQWEDEPTPYGKLFLGVYDWAFSKQGTTLKIEAPNLIGGGSVPNNENAAATLGGEPIYGDCFLKPKDANAIISLDELIADKGITIQDKQ